MLRSLIILSSFVFFAGSAVAGEPVLVKTDLQILAEQTSGSLSGGALNDGYEIKQAAFTELPESLLEKVNEINKKRLKEWAVYVKTSGEIDDEDMDNAIANPQEYWGSSQPLRLNDVFLIYKDGVLIGMAADYADMVDSSIIQDGSGWVFFVDLNDNLVAVNDWQS